jgi:hypothetical protein
MRIKALVGDLEKLIVPICKISLMYTLTAVSSVSERAYIRTHISSLLLFSSIISLNKLYRNSQSDMLYDKMLKNS